MDFRTIKIKDRLPDFGQRIFFFNSTYGTHGLLPTGQQGYVKEYDPNEIIEIKKGKFIEMKDCQIAKDYLLKNFDSWLEPTQN